MKTGKALLYALTVSILILGLRISLSWSYTSRIVGLCLVGLSLLILYISYTKYRKEVAYTSQINIKNLFLKRKALPKETKINENIKGISLGFLLILIDVSYNLYAGDEFAYFDYGMLTAGFFIILLNSGLLRFLKLEDWLVSFSTYFIFILMLSYGFLFTGIPFIFKSPENVYFNWFTSCSVTLSAFLLECINPNVSLSGTTINFDSFKVGIGYACSGIESITVFLSAVVAYFIATKEKSIKKICLYSVIGIGALYIMNILRIMAIVLVGFYFGHEEMMFVHLHLGWVIFVMGMAVFWYLIFR